MDDFYTTLQAMKADQHKKDMARLYPQPQPEPPPAMTRDQLNAKLKAEQRARDRVAETVASRVPRAQVNPFAQRLADLKEKRAFAVPAEIPALDRAIRMYKQGAEKWEAEQEAKAARAEYDALPIIVNMREHSLAFERSPPPGSDEAAVALAIATAKSDLFSGDGTDQAKLYWSDIAKIESDAEARQREQLGESVAVTKDTLVQVEEQQKTLEDTAARARAAREQAAAAGGEDAE